MSKINLLNTNDEEAVLKRIADFYQRSGAVIEDLNEDEQQLVRGIEQAHALMIRTDHEQWADREYVVGVLIKDFDISRATAYRYIDYANKLKATETVAQHNYRRFILSRHYERMMEKCQVKGDAKGLQKIGEEYAKINRLYEPMQDQRNWQEVLSSKQIVLTTNPKALNRPEIIDESEAIEIIQKLEVKAKKKSLGFRDE